MLRLWVVYLKVKYFSDVTSHLINNKMTQLHVSLKNSSSGHNLIAAVKRKAALFRRQSDYSHLT